MGAPRSRNIIASYLRFLLHFLILSPLLAAASGKSSGLCVSPGGRFPPFALEGKPPKKALKGAGDLVFCRNFRKCTCCDAAQTYQSLLSVKRLVSYGEASQECVELWEVLECAICDPHVGVQPGLIAICETLCNKILAACSDAYFFYDPNYQLLSPCGERSLVCTRATELASNGTDLCRIAGFSVQSSSLIAGEPICYDGKPLETIPSSCNITQPDTTNEYDEHMARKVPSTVTALLIVAASIGFVRMWYRYYRKRETAGEIVRRRRQQAENRQYGARRSH